MLTTELLLAAYAQGYFPMAPARDSADIRWYSPDPRAVIPLEAFHCPKRLAREARHPRWRISRNAAFAQVIAACATIPRRHEDGSWISPYIEQAYTALHEEGHAHSVEVWQEDTLVGGLYGVQLGGAFFGESMFSHAPNASKVALVHLVQHLRARGFTLLDTQFVNPHLLQFGVVEIPREAYLAQLSAAAERIVMF